MKTKTSKLQLSQAVVVEGRDDVDAVSKAIDALIIPTHGFGITKETWEIIEKADKEKGLIVLTDPDFSGEEIRRKISEKYPNSIQAYISQEDAMSGDDIGVENATVEVIVSAIKKAVENSKRIEGPAQKPDKISMKEMMTLGLAGTEQATEFRKKLCAKLGIGYSNAKTLANKLEHWGIGIKELEQTIQEITNQ